MKNKRYDYAPMVERSRIEWPHGARLALWVGPNIEAFHLDKPLPRNMNDPLPDVQSYSLRDYGARVGVFRMMDVLDKYGIRASVLLNAEVCQEHPAIIEAGNERGWEWLGHGMNNNVRLNSYSPKKERKIIRTVRDTITAATGQTPRGWLGPGLAETYDTPDHLAAEGFDYLCDWGCDDRPAPMRVKKGRMITMPYQQGINDMSLLVHSYHTAEQYYRIVCDQFDTLYNEAQGSGLVMAIPLHPYVTGLPFRIRYLDRALDYICGHDGVWKATGGEIASWYYEHYYKDPGKP